MNVTGDSDDGYTVESGIIVAVRPGELVVRVEKNTSECDGCGSCALKKLCHGRGPGKLDLPVQFSAGGGKAVEGQRVRIAYKQAGAAVAGLVMFVPPLLGLLLGGLAGYHFGKGGDADLLAGCFAGLAAGLGSSFAAYRLSPALKVAAKLLPD